MTTLPKPPTRHNLAQDAKRAIDLLRPAHVLWITHCWPTRLDEYQYVCTGAGQTDGEGAYEALRRYQAQYGLPALRALCWTAEGRDEAIPGIWRAGTVRVDLLVMLGAAAVAAATLWASL